MKKQSLLTTRGLICLGAGLLAVGAKPHQASAQEATPAAQPHHPAKMKGWTTQGEKPKSGDPLTTASLTKEMKEALATIVLGTKSSATAKFDQKSKEEKPFWAGMKGASTSVNAMEKALAARDQKAYLASEGDLGRFISQINVSWKLLKKKDEKISKGLLALSRSYRIYDEHYSGEAARRKKGGDLTDLEKTNLEKLRKQEAELLEKLKKLKVAANEARNKVALEMIADLERKAKRIAKSKGEGVDHYTHECTLISEQFDELSAYNELMVDYYSKTDFYTQWQTLDENRATVRGYCREIQTEEYDWDYTTESVTEYGDYYNVEVEASPEEVANSKEYAEAYSEESATEEMADEEATIEEDASEDAEAASDEESLDDEGDSEEMEADDEPDDGDDSDGDSDDSGDDAAFGQPGTCLILAETHADLLQRYWPVVELHG